MLVDDLMNFLFASESSASGAFKRLPLPIVCITVQVLSGETIVPLLVHRFVNGMPMLDTNTSSACALVVGVSKSGWRGLGLKISTSRVHHREGRLRFVLSEAPTPLKVKICLLRSAFSLLALSSPSISILDQLLP